MSFYDVKSKEEMENLITKFQENAKLMFEVEIPLHSLKDSVQNILAEKMGKFVRDTFEDLSPANLLIARKTLNEMMNPELKPQALADSFQAAVKRQFVGDPGLSPAYEAAASYEHENPMGMTIEEVRDWTGNNSPNTGTMARALGNNTPSAAGSQKPSNQNKGPMKPKVN